MLQSRQAPDILIIGAGPVGLNTAIQLKSKSPSLHIQMIEKHTTYKRGQHLRLDLNNFENDEVRTKLRDLTHSTDSKLYKSCLSENMKISIKTLEARLKEYATELGVVIKHERLMTEEQIAIELKESGLTSVTDLAKKSDNKIIAGKKEFDELYGNCKLVICADGARSTARQMFFGKDENFVTNYPKQHLVQFTFETPGKQIELSELDDLRTQHCLPDGFYCIEEGKYDAKKDITHFTLRFFVDNVTFSLIPDAKLSKPLTKEHFSKLPENIRKAINIWLNAREKITQETVVENTFSITKIPLDVYTSNTYSKEVNGVQFYLVGDAAFSVPYFRALNAGLQCSNQISDLINKAIRKRNVSQLINDCNAAIKNIFSTTNTKTKLTDLGLNSRTSSIDISAQFPIEMIPGISWDDDTVEQFNKLRPVFAGARLAGEDNVPGFFQRNRSAVILLALGTGLLAYISGKYFSTSTLITSGGIGAASLVYLNSKRYLRNKIKEATDNIIIGEYTLNEILWPEPDSTLQISKGLNIQPSTILHHDEKTVIPTKPASLQVKLDNKPEHSEYKTVLSRRLP